MEESRNGSNTENIDRASEIFQWFNSYLKNATNRGIEWERVTGGTDDLSYEEAVCSDNENVVQQHMISSVVFRWIETENGDEWKLENVWDNVYIHQLDDIGKEADYEWHPLNYHGEKDIQAAMAENMNIILQRTIIDWSRLDGNVWSQQIVWSGSFTDFHRILEPSEDNSNSLNLIIVIGQHFVLHPHLREQYIARHGTSHPTAAAIAAVDSSPKVIIQVEMMQTEGDRLICAICHDVLSNGEDAKQLPCNHLFHSNCLFNWFYVKLECPLCRYQFQCETASLSPSP